MLDTSISDRVLRIANGLDEPVEDVEEQLENLVKAFEVSRKSLFEHEASARKPSSAFDDVGLDGTLGSNWPKVHFAPMNLASDGRGATSAHRFVDMFAATNDAHGHGENSSRANGHAGTHGAPSSESESEKLEKKAEKAAAKARENNKSFTDAVLLTAKVFAQVGQVFVSVATDVASASARWSATQVAFRDNELASLEGILGSQKDAERVFKKALDFASKTPFSSSETLNRYEQFLKAGFGEDQLDTLMAALGDVDATSGSEAKSKVASVLEKIQKSGKVDIDSIKQLDEVGIGKEDVFQALEENGGAPRGNAEELVRSGKVTSGDGVDAVLNAIQKSMSGGKLGSSMERKMTTFGSMFSSLMEVPSNLFQSSKVDEAFAPIRLAMWKLLGSFETGRPLFEKGVEVIDRISVAWGKAFSSVDEEAIEGLASGIMDLMGVFGEDAAAFVEGFLPAFSEGMKGLFGFVGEADVEHFKNLGAEFANIIVGAAYLTDALVELVVFLQKTSMFIQKYSNYFKMIVSPAWGISGLVSDKIAESLRPNEGSSEVGMPKGEAGDPMTEFRNIRDARSPTTISSVVGDVHVHLDGDDANAALRIASDIRSQLPGELSNWSTEHGG